MIGFRWIAMHTAYERNRLFVEFEVVGVNTRLTDRVEYLLPGGAIINILFGWLVTIGLRQMFRHRQSNATALCNRLVFA